MRLVNVVAAIVERVWEGGKQDGKWNENRAKAGGCGGGDVSNNGIGSGGCRDDGNGDEGGDESELVMTRRRAGCGHLDPDRS